MKKILAMVLCFVTLLTCAVGVLANNSMEIKALIVNPMVDIGKTVANPYLDNPLISYNNHTYIALRDVAKFFDCNVIWWEETGNISLVYNIREDIVKSEKAATAIALAVMADNYSDKFNEDSIYCVSRVECDCIGGRNNFYEIEVVFEPDTALWEETKDDFDSRLKFYNSYADVIVRICTETGEVTIEER